VIGLSHSLGVQTVAEGVETEHDAQALRGLGCGMAQGYLFGRRCRPNGSSARCRSRPGSRPNRKRLRPPERRPGAPLAR
jgi:EAL domain-containing protein (putative c-di-GMP-specific phosphodiesterase class I)